MSKVDISSSSIFLPIKRFYGKLNWLGFQAQLNATKDLLAEIKISISSDFMLGKILVM